MCPKKRERPSLEPAFGLSVLGYCRNTAVQHGRGPAPCVDMKAHSKLMQTQRFLVSGDYTRMKTHWSFQPLKEKAKCFSVLFSVLYVSFLFCFPKSFSSFLRAPAIYSCFLLMWTAPPFSFMKWFVGQKGTSTTHSKAFSLPFSRTQFCLLSSANYMCKICLEMFCCRVVWCCWQHLPSRTSDMWSWSTTGGYFTHSLALKKANEMVYCNLTYLGETGSNFAQSQ